MTADQLARQTIQNIRLKNGKHLFDKQIGFLENAKFKWKIPIIWPFQKSVTTLSNNTIYLTKDFIMWPANEREAVLIHEAGHLEQYKNGKFNMFEYLTNRQARFTLEIQAEHVAILYRCAIGQVRKANLGEYAIQQANIWPEQYWITGIKTPAEWFQLFKDICSQCLAVLNA